MTAADDMPRTGERWTSLDPREKRTVLIVDVTDDKVVVRSEGLKRNGLPFPQKTSRKESFVKRYAKEEPK